MRNNENPTPNTEGGKSKWKKANAGKGSANATKFTFMEHIENDPVIAEIPENEANVATRQMNLANALGVGDWVGWNRPGYCSSIIDAGFNGGGRASILGCEDMLNT